MRIASCLLHISIFDKGWALKVMAGSRGEKVNTCLERLNPTTLTWQLDNLKRVNAANENDTRAATSQPSVKTV